MLLLLWARRRGSAWPGLRPMIGVTCLLGLTLALVSCGATPSETKTPTQTPQRTVTATPVPCTSWRVVASPNVTSLQDSQLRAVSAASPGEAWAVGGAFTDGLAEQTLIERWDGSSWSIVPNPNTITLSSVVAVSANDVWVAGYNVTPRQEGRITLIEHWNGTQWSSVPSPTPQQPNNFLLSMAAVSVNDVWAVGQIYNASNISLPLTERWNGTAWNIVANPALPGATESSLNSAAWIPGTNQVWTVGYVLQGPRPAYETPLIERWTGTAWEVVAAPGLPNGAVSGRLRGVAAISATDAWAVGDYTASNHTIRTLVAHWNGANWQLVDSPDTWGTLQGVAAANAHDVRAVGRSFQGDGNDQHSLIEQWNGATWHEISSVEPSGAAYSNLTSIASDGVGHFWTVGATQAAGSHDQTLTAHCP